MLQDFDYYNYEWEEEKIKIKSLICFENKNNDALNYIESLLPLILINKNKDIIYCFLFSKALCLYKLNNIDKCIDVLNLTNKYAQSLHEKMKVDWTYGLCYEKDNIELACKYYDKAIINCESRIIPDNISSGQIKCTKATLINNIMLMEQAVNQIHNNTNLMDILDTAYTSLCNIYIKNNLYLNAYKTIKKIKNKNIQTELKNKILIK